MDGIPHQELTYQIIGYAMDVHNELGPGLREGIYQRALGAKLASSGVPFELEKKVEIFVDDVSVGLLYIDVLVADCVIVEIKALRHQLTNDEVGQTITYLGATGHQVGLLLNFAGKRLEYRRIFPPKKIDAWKDRIRRYAWTPERARATG